MKVADFERSIRSGFQCLRELKLTDWDRQISLRCIVPQGSYKKLALDPEIDYETLFKAGLRCRAYNFLLEDYSYFQFWHDANYQPRRLRYAYHPNPFQLVTVEDLVLDNFEMQLESEMRSILSQALEEAPVRIGKPPIRYDLALDDRIECEHPAAHFTVGHHARNRWPVARILTPKLFVLFVAKHYYPEEWSLMVCDKKTKDGFTHQFDQTIADEKIKSASLDEQCFSTKERRHLFVG